MRQRAVAFVVSLVASAAAAQTVTAPAPRTAIPEGIAAAQPVVVLADCSEAEPNETFAASTPMALPANCNGFASSTDASSIRIDYGGGVLDGVEDFYQFTLSSSARVSASLSWSNTGADLDVFLFPASGPIIVGSNTVGSSPESFTSSTLAPGTYYIGVSAFSGGTNYTLNVSTVSSSSNCSSNNTTLCLGNNRFRVQTTYDTGSQSGSGGGVKLTSDTGYFWFFGNANVEMVVKILDACSFNNRFWVFAGGLTDVGVSLNITDTQTGQVKTYSNPRGTAFKAIQDTEAFATCQTGACTFALGAPSPSSFSSGGGSGSVSMTAAAGCSWSASSSDPSWLTITGGASGSGNGTINFNAAANGGAGSRSATISAGGQSVTITQSGTTPTCTYNVSPTSANFGSSGGTGSVTVTAPAGCAWTANSSFSFINITSGASGSGNGTVSYSVAANSGSARTGGINVAGQTVSIAQSGAPAPNYDGHWAGATSQQRAFSFDVVNNRITGFKLDWATQGSNCSATGTTTTTYGGGGIAINGSSFSLSSSPSPSISINGTFSSNTAASGNFTVTNPFGCTSSGNGTFNVTKQ
jgi:Bacterial pre-peptidase C-terminal domain/Putative binding domain, N-terminal